MTIAIYVLGPIRIEIDGQPCQLGSRQLARLATLLAGWPGEVIDAQRIIDVLSRERPLARNTLQVHISHLRKLLGAHRVVSRNGGYVLDIARDDVDTYMFERAIQLGTRAMRAQRYASAQGFFIEALNLWRAQAFHDVEDVELAAKREFLDEMHAHAVEQSLECELHLVQDSEDISILVGRLRAAAAQRPEREYRWTLLIRALATGDRLSEAGHAFTNARSEIKRASGLDPGAELIDTYEKALASAVELVPDTWRLHHNLSWSSERGTISDDPRVNAMVSRLRRMLFDNPHTDIWIALEDIAPSEIAAALGRAIRGDFRVGVHIHDADAADLVIPVDGTPELLIIAYGSAERLIACRDAWDRGPFGSPTFVFCCTAPPPRDRQVQLFAQDSEAALG